MSKRWRVEKMNPGTGWLAICPAERHGHRYGEVLGCYCDWHYSWRSAMSWANRCAWREERSR